MMATLPVGYSTRAPQHDDIPAILALMAACDIAALGTADAYTTEDILDDWSHLNLARDAWVLITPDGALAAYGTVIDYGHGQLHADGYVHPSHRGRGLGTALVRLTERRARDFIAAAPESARVVLGNGLLMEDEAARAILEREGYTLARAYWRMGIALDAPPPEVVWPVGISVRTFVRGQDDHPVFDAVQEAFSDHWGHVPRPFADWVRRFERSDFDPSLSLLAMEGSEIAGVALCAQRPDMGWINTLGVRRPWRQRGLGLALLREAFGRLYARGERRVGLGVDAQSLTGATRLYERAGMRVTMRIASYQKELRPGRDLSVQALVE
ncbi:MAG: GNAT family N-acetyltransferase [Ktedonobacterales bacterium]|nr:GNAT family N-acetyltransferase [Ktedonobacterales bacterium]